MLLALSNIVDNILRWASESLGVGNLPLRSASSVKIRASSPQSSGEVFIVIAIILSPFLLLVYKVTTNFSHNQSIINLTLLFRLWKVGRAHLGRNTSTAGLWIALSVSWPCLSIPTPRYAWASLAASHKERWSRSLFHQQGYRRPWHATLLYLSLIHISEPTRPY